MPLYTNTNIQAMNVRRSVNRSRNTHTQQIEIAGSGFRVRRAANDASGVSISEGMRSEVTKISQSVRNGEHASDLLRIAEGSLGTATTVLQRMRVLAMQASNGDLNNRQRAILTNEYDQASAALDRIAQATLYNGRVLLAGFAAVDEAASTVLTEQADTGVVAVKLSGADQGTYTFTDNDGGKTITVGNGIVSQTVSVARILDGTRVAVGSRVIANFDRLGVEVTLAGVGAVKPAEVGDYVSGNLDGRTLVVGQGDGETFQLGPGTEDADRLSFSLPDLRASGDTLDLDKVSLASQPGARFAIGKIDAAITSVSQERGKIGALLNRVGHSIRFSENEIENLTNSESTIRDADMAKVASLLARSELLENTSTIMLTQAFANSRTALQLL